MAKLEKISKDRVVTKLLYLRENWVVGDFHNQLKASYELDMTIEVYLKGSDMPFEGIVYGFFDESFALVEKSGKITRILNSEIQAIRTQESVEEEPVELIKSEDLEKVVKNP